MKRLFCLLMLVLVTGPLLGQGLIDFEGLVADSTGTPLELAHVVAQDEAGETVVSYGVTDHEGRFVLKLTKGTTYLLKVSFIGYETHLEKFQASEALFQVTLKPSLAELQAMEIVEELPVTISGDTIIYQAEAFTNGTERKLEDVLEALPGFEVNEYGEVKVQGKDVEKILVEGKEFFEGDEGGTGGKETVDKVCE